MRQEWGVAVQSFYMAVGSLVCGARAGAGVVVTQGLANPAAIDPALDRLEAGGGAAETLRQLISASDRVDRRQFGVLDRSGQHAHHSGDACPGRAAVIEGENWLVIGNTAQAGAIEAMASALAGSTEKSTALRLLEALRGGAEAGGDRRGDLAAALKVVRSQGGFLGQGDLVADLRVDADPEPVAKLHALLQWHALYYSEIPPERMVSVQRLGAEDKRKIREILARWMREAPSAGDRGLLTALVDFNLGSRADCEHGLIDSGLAEDLAFLSR